MWFPRPASEERLRFVGGSTTLDEAKLFALLTDPAAEEWRDKVGVAGSAEGSAKATTRLLAVLGWVLKTDLAEVTDEVGVVVQRGTRRAALAQEVPVWHPSKAWFAMETDGVFLLVSACVNLTTLRRLAPFEARAEAWGRMVAWALAVSSVNDVGMDLHPSNFGLESDQLYYLDDELYPAVTLWDAGHAIAGRIPEERATPERWEQVGRVVARHLEDHVSTASDWAALESGLADRPLVERFEPERTALRRGMSLIADKRRIRRRGAPNKLCLLADVHANLPALRAVLDEAGRLGVDGYLFLGDAVGYGPHPRECIEVLAGLDNLVGIRGNHDQVALARRPDDGMNRAARIVSEWTAAHIGEAERAWLSSLPRELSGAGWLAVHGAPRDPERLYAYVYELTFRENLEVLHEQGVPLCFYGHTHVPFVHRRSESGQVEKLGAAPVRTGDERTRLLVNPGSVGQSRDGDSRSSFAVWDREAGRISFHRVEYAVAHTIRDLERAGFPRDLAYRLETGR